MNSVFNAASYLGNSDNFDRALVEFAFHYAEQNYEDFKEFQHAIEAGRLQANIIEK